MLSQPKFDSSITSAQSSLDSTQIVRRILHASRLQEFKIKLARENSILKFATTEARQ
jgi:hypothetical protein